MEDHHAGPSDATSPARWEMERLTRCRRSHAEGAPPFPLDVSRSRFPFAIVWCPLPGITSLLPVVGHMGICDSRGVVMDFAGPYCIGVDQMAFSKPFLYCALDPALAAARAPGQGAAAAWDAGVDAGCDEYLGRMHNICADNCHSHVARCLNEMRYKGRDDWSMVGVGALCLLNGRWVSPAHALCVWAPFVVIVVAALCWALL